MFTICITDIDASVVAELLKSSKGGLLFCITHASHNHGCIPGWVESCQVGGLITTREYAYYYYYYYRCTKTEYGFLYDNVSLIILCTNIFFSKSETLAPRNISLGERFSLVKYLLFTLMLLTFEQLNRLLLRPLITNRTGYTYNISYRSNWMVGWFVLTFNNRYCLKKNTVVHKLYYYIILYRKNCSFRTTITLIS